MTPPKLLLNLSANKTKRTKKVIFSSLRLTFQIGLILILFGIWNYHFGTPFFHSSSSLNFDVFWTWNYHFFSSSLSGCGMPYFFLVWHFSILGLSIFCTFWGYLEFFSSAVWAFRVYSCLSGCGMPYFFFGPTFFYFGT